MPIVTTQQTSKRYKALQVAGVVLLVLGVVIRVNGEYWGVAVALIGLLVYALGRFLAWWNHG